MSLRRWIGAALAGALLVGAGAAGGQPAPIDITADTVEYERPRHVYSARGNVVIRRGDRTLRADWVAFNPTTRHGVASGNVVITEGEERLDASFVQFNVDTLRGVIYAGRLDSVESGFRLEGAEVRKTGDRTYVFEEGVFTTCRCPEEGRDPWAIKAERADAEVGGYGTARNTTFEVLGVPVLWLPWMVYPLLTERQSGFLLPEFNVTSRDGTDVGLPFFWAARENLNVVLTPSWLSRRGFMPKLELEYVFGERSSGELFASYLHDTQVDPDDPGTPFGPDRAGLTWRHDQDLPHGVRLAAEANAVSDNHYAFDFKDFGQFRSDRFLESRAFASRQFGAGGHPSGVVAGVAWADDLQSPDDQDRDAFLLQRLPYLEFHQLPAPLPKWSRLVGAFDLRYAHFYQRRRAEDVYEQAAVVGDHLFLDTGVDALPNGQERDAAGVRQALDVHADDFPLGSELDGRFQEGEPLADRGHRLLLNPRLALPLRLGERFELYPEVAYHGTFYWTEAQELEQRSLVTGRLDLATRLRGDLGLPFGLGQAAHLVEPRLSYVVVSSVSQSDKPLFVPGTRRPQVRVRQLELENVTRDPADRLPRRNGLVLGVANRFYGAGGEGGFPRLLADVVTSLAYELSGTRFGQALLDGRLYPTEGTLVRFNFGYDLDVAQVQEGLFEVGWTSESGHHLDLGYRYLRDIPAFFETFPFDDRFDRVETGFDRIDQFALSTRIAFTPRWAATWDVIYSLEEALFLDNLWGVEYTSKCRCWALRVEVGDDRGAGLSVGVRYALLGLGDDRARPFGGGRSRPLYP